MLQQIARTLDTIRRQMRGVQYASSVRVTCAAAGAYAALDVLSVSVTDGVGTATYIPNLASEPGGTATIMSIAAKCSATAVLASLRLHFFRNPPAPADVEMDDNIPFSLKTATGGALWAGSILLNALVGRGTAFSTSDTEDIRKPIKCAPEAQGLWMVVTTEVAEANQVANMTLDFDFYTL